MRREYPRKPGEELRVPVTFSLSGKRLKRFRDKFILEHKQSYEREPTEQEIHNEIRRRASDIALQAIDTYCGYREK